jgi:predicted dehydrogenase
MEKLQWGVLGAGGIADRRTLPGMALAGNARLRAVMEIDPANAEALCLKHGAEIAYTGEDALLRDPGVQAVYIASPVAHHARQCEKAIAAGKHVLVEKPIAMNAAESAALCDRAERAGLLMASGLMMRYNTYHQRMKRMIAEGAIGQVVSCHAQFTCWYPDMPGAWRQYKAKAGGGAMTDMGIHCLDLIEYITGQRIREVGALSETLTFHYDVEDSCSALMRLSGGGFATVDTNFNIPDDAAKCRLEIYGTAGSFRAEGSIGQNDGGEVFVVLSDPTRGYDAMQRRGENADAKMEGAGADLYAREIESFGESVLRGAPLVAPARDAARVQAVIETIYRSAEAARFLPVR